MNAVLKETLRWHTVLPLGASHVTQQDITYRGYIIPKGSTLIANAWYVLGPRIVSAVRGSLALIESHAIVQGLHARSECIQ